MPFHNPISNMAAIATILKIPFSYICCLNPRTSLGLIAPYPAYGVTHVEGFLKICTLLDFPCTMKSGCCDLPETHLVLTSFYLGHGWPSHLRCRSPLCILKACQNPMIDFNQRFAMVMTSGLQASFPCLTFAKGLSI